jgi:hypothetical protein
MDSKGWVAKIDYKFYCRKCWKVYNAQQSEDDVEAADNGSEIRATQDDKVPPQNYSMVLDSPYCSSDETTDDGASSAKTTDKAPATGSVGNAGMKVKEEPGETSSTPRVKNPSTNEKGPKSNDIVFTALKGSFPIERSTATAQEGPSHPKKQRETPAWLHSGPIPKQISKKTTPAKGSEWIDLLAPELNKLAVRFGLRLGNVNKSELIEKIQDYLGKGPDYGPVRESGLHDPLRFNLEGFVGEPLNLYAYVKCCTEGGKDSKWEFQYSEDTVKQEKSKPVEAVAKKAKIERFPVSTSMTAVPRNVLAAKRRREEPISQEPSDDEPESQEMIQEQLESQEQPESQEMIQEQLESQEQPESQEKSQEQTESQEQPESQEKSPPIQDYPDWTGGALVYEPVGYAGPSTMASMGATMDLAN